MAVVCARNLCEKNDADILPSSRLQSPSTPVALIAASPLGHQPQTPGMTRKSLDAGCTTPSQEDHSLTALYLQIVQSRPDELAVLSASENLSYRELHNRAVVVAQALRRLGVERGTLVGLYLPRSTWSMVAVLGTLLAGGAYIPGSIPTIRRTGSASSSTTLR